ncbi:MAG: hypothetical protein ACOYI4_08035 [Christensenellales bacterium]|jgi:hypothetical protein
MSHKKYPTLKVLLQNNNQAKSYYESLPDYVRESIASRGDNVNSLASLQDYAENLLRGDG